MIQTILLRLPNWLGDSVMCTSAFQKLKRMYPHAQFVLVGKSLNSAFAQIVGTLNAKQSVAQNLIKDQD